MELQYSTVQCEDAGHGSLLTYLKQSCLGSAMAQAVSHRPLTTAAWVRAQVNGVGIVVDKVALGQVFLRVLRLPPVNIIPPWAPFFRKLKKIVHSLFHSHPGTNNRPVKAAAVQ
jgi:hypothetical protein